MDKITIAFSLFLVLLGMTACSLEELFEKEEKLPEITPETRKAFGFLLDGKVLSYKSLLLRYPMLPKHF